ncbi:MAG: hypothetical protein NKF70_10190 [Methanobacterium sp. ERen5]|nr:MAG: hypothetical protein NKF70_10190 [Methanobacterium sp. ERen5]
MYSIKSEITSLVVPMGIGSIIGAFLVIYAPSELLNFILGALLIFPSIKIFTEKE